MFIIEAINKIKEVRTGDAELYDIKHRYETFIESYKEESE